jgi:NADH dehydrogenase
VALLRTPEQQSVPIACVAAVRSDRAASELRAASPETSRVIRVSYRDPKSLREALDGATAIVHLAGVLVERPGSTFEEANVETTRSVVEAAKECAVQKFVYVSAVGADAASANRYWRTKGQAEALVRRSGLCHTVLRAPLLLGRGTEGAAALQRQLSRKSVALVGGGRNLQQPLLVDDLAHAALLAAVSPVAANQTLDLVGPTALPDREILERAARLMGRRIRIWSVPKGLAWLTLAIRQRFSATGFSLDALDVVTSDTNLDPGPAARELGIRLSEIDEMIRCSIDR